MFAILIKYIKEQVHYGKGDIRQAWLIQIIIFLVCMCYIELNPVRANMTEVPGEYTWSSYQTNAYGDNVGCITPHPVYMALSEVKDERLYNYRELFSNALDYEQLHDIRESLNQELVLGSGSFKEKIEIMVNRRVVHGKAGRPYVKETQGFYYVY